MTRERHTIHMPDGTRVEVVGDRYEVHLAKPIIVHRRKWICGLTTNEEVRRTLDTTAVDPIAKALETAFRAVLQVVHSDDDDRPRHYDSNGYCDNPGRGY